MQLSKKNNIQNEIYIHNDSFNVLKLKEEYTRSKTDEIGEKIFHKCISIILVPKFVHGILFKYTRFSSQVPSSDVITSLCGYSSVSDA